MRRLLLVVLLLALTVAVLPAQAQNDGVDIVLNPSDSTVEVGEVFNVVVQVTTPGSQQVDGVEVHLEFDPAVLQVTSVTVGADNPLVIPLLPPTVDNTNGTIGYAGGLLGSTGPAPFTALNLEFQAIGAGTTDIVFSDTFPQSGATFGGGSVLNSTTDGSVTVNAPNTAPTANAGPDQNVADSDGLPGEAVDLDGSVSEDSDGTIVSYIWTDENDNEVATGATPTGVQLPDGTNTLTLTVTDDGGESDSDEVTIEVQPFVDDEAPVITLLGDPVVSINEGDTYTDAGATASDNVDGNITGDIVTLNPVDTSTVGTYTVTYNVSDAAGNAADEVSRTVNVLPAGNADLVITPGTETVPVNTTFTLDVEVQSGSQAFDAAEAHLSFDPTYLQVVNLTAGNTLPVGIMGPMFDNTQGTIAYASGMLGGTTSGTVTLLTIEFEAIATVASTDITFVNPDGVPDNMITYLGFDILNNTVGGSVTINTNNVPVIMITGANPLNHEVNTDYTDPGATANDAEDGNLTVNVVNNVDDTTLGEYEVDYSVTDSDGNTVTDSRTVNVVDTTAPVIELIDENPLTLLVGQTFVDPGVTVSDNYDDVGDINVQTSDNVDTSTPGNYSITYTATDTEGNSASITRDVIVQTGAFPVITITGANPVDHEVNTTYTDAGATANDTEDGDLTGSIITNNTVDTGALGSYTVDYSVTDTQGNTTQVSRTVNVVDTTAPEITLLGLNPLNLTVGDTFVDPGVNVSDNFDPAPVVMTNGTVDTSVAGTYPITYKATDSSGNESVTLTRDVVVSSNDVPVITVTGANPVDHEVNTTYTDEGATANDTEDGDLTGSIITNNNVDTGALGSYTVDYSVTDTQGNTTQVSRTVNVVDTTAPEITLLGLNPLNLFVGDTFDDPGVNVSDNFDPAPVVTTNGTVDTSVAGTYPITYKATDSSGNESVTLTRNVVVSTNDVPVITITGANPVDHEVNTTYTDEGATATDTEDGDLTGSIITNNTVDTGALGSYTVDYSVTDSDGNTATAFRTVNVVDTTAPVLTLNGENPLNLFVGDTFDDPGVNVSDNFDPAPVVTTNGTVDTSVAGTYPITYKATDSSGNESVTLTRDVVVSTNDVPVITVTGANPVDHEVNTTYTDEGATATDTEDGDLTGSIQTVNNVDTGALGSYTVDYSVTDTQGNTTTAFRTVNVVDTTAPVILLYGTNPLNLTVGDSFSDPGVEVSDNFDPQPFLDITNNVDTSTPGTYFITYTATDASGNSASITRDVIVSSNDTPVITITGANPVDHEVNTTYTDEGATANDTEDGDLTGSIQTVNNVDTSALGSYTVDYSVTDSDGNTATAFRTVNVVDTTAPVILLYGTNPLNLTVGDSFSDPGVEVSDNFDPQPFLDITNNVDTSVAGTYFITYTATDASGNSTTVTRDVVVSSNDVPVITVTGDNPVDHEVNTTYTDEGATATDTEDGDLTGSIITNNTVDTGALGSYTVDYSVTDSDGNTATAFRTVNVVDTTAPVILLYGTNPLNLTVGDSFSDPGVEVSDNFDPQPFLDITNNIDTSMAGTYFITYTATDASGNSASITRDVIVSPVVTTCGPLYQEAEDGDLTGFTVANQSGNSSGQSIVNLNEVNYSGPTTTTTKAAYCFTVTQPGTYQLQATAFGTDNNGDSFYVEFGGTESLWDFPTTGTWFTNFVTNRGVSGPTQAVLEAGEHTVIVSQREKSSYLDSLHLILMDAGSNQPPIAVAGADIIVTDTDNSGTEAVTLNAANSFDNDGSIVSYTWAANGVTIPAVVSPMAEFPQGTTTVTLTVTDNDGASSTDTVDVTVNAPVVGTCGPLYQEAEDGDLTGFTIVNQSANGNSQSIVNLTEVNYGGPTTTTTKAVYCFTVTQPGTYQLQATAFGTDNDGDSFYVEFGGTENLWDFPMTGTWFTDFVTNRGVSGPTQAVLEAGEHTVIVSQREKNSHLDNLQLVLMDAGGNQPPVAVAGADITVSDGDNSGTEAVTLDASNSFDSDGSIVSYAWTANGLTIPAVVSPTVEFPQGTTTVTLTVTDNEGSTGTDTVDVTVTPPVVSTCGPLFQEAEDGDLTGFTIVNQSASGLSQSIVNPDEVNFNGPSATTTKAVYCFTVTQPGTYQLQATAFGATNDFDSFFVEFGGTESLWDFPTSGTWFTNFVTNRGVSGPTQAFLEAGEHTVIISQREKEAYLDNLQLVLVSELPLVTTNVQQPAPTGARDLGVRAGTLTWTASPNAVWYQVWIGTSEATPRTLYQEWIVSDLLDCQTGGVCTLLPELVAPAGYTGDLQWYVQAYGPGGISIGGIDGWTAGPTIDWFAGEQPAIEPILPPDPRPMPTQPAIEPLIEPGSALPGTDIRPRTDG